MSESRQVTVDLGSDLMQALDRFIDEFGVTPDEAISVIVRDWLTSHGYFRHLDLEDDTETEGEA